MANELKSCPFCGATAEMQPWHGGAPTKQLISCSDDQCDVGPSVTGETPEEAATRWNTRPSAPVEGLETVQYECNEGDGWWDCGKSRHDHEQNQGTPTRELVTRSQAETIIAAERVKYDAIVDSLSIQLDRVNAFEADNAALTARVKELNDALKRQSDNMAFVLNHMNTEGWYDKFTSELSEDRAALEYRP